MSMSKKQINFIEKYNLKLKEKNINWKIINHIDKNYYTFRCDKHWECKITSKNIIKRLYSNQTPALFVFLMILFENLNKNIMIYLKKII